MSRPISFNRVALTVRDLDRMTHFYSHVVGLSVLDEAKGLTQLGAGDRVLLELRHDSDARARKRGEAGLYHSAFLLPDRASLGGFLKHAIQNCFALTGASDHGVSEALYMDDPEGNGIEIYADRNPRDWDRIGKRIKMYTRRLEAGNLIEAATPWNGAPDGTTIGHVHLAVGNLKAADKFMSDTLGLTRTFDAPGGAWYGWNGYHHHFAANAWNTAGAPPREFPTAGLAEIVLNTRNDRGGDATLVDPWGTPIRIAA